MAIKKESGAKSAPPKSVPPQAVKAQKAEEKITPTVAKNKVEAAKAVATETTKAADKADLLAVKIATGRVVGANPNLITNTDGVDIPKNGGPSGDKNIISDDFDNSKSTMDSIPEATENADPAVVRTPTRNVTDISSLVPQFDAEQIQKLLFENISAIELSKVERHDTIEGIDQKYSIISNLSEVRKKYDMVKQLTIMDKFKPLTSIFTINIEDKIPQEDYLKLENLNSTYQYLDENNSIVTRKKGYYYIDTNGDLVIELVNLEKNQQVEILIDTNGTIYKVES
jgi:hypothetical protein